MHVRHCNARPTLQRTPDMTRRMANPLRIAVAALMLAAAASCGGGNEDSPVEPVAPPTVASVNVIAATTALSVRQSSALSVRAYDSRGTLLTPSAVGWSSSNTGIATVAADGSLVGVSPGSARITATVDGISGVLDVIVTPAVVAQVLLSVGPQMTFVVNDTMTLQVTVLDATGTRLTDRPIIWETSSAGTARITPSGFLTATGVGGATLKATVDGKSASTAVLVTLLPLEDHVSNGALSARVGRPGHR